MALRPDVIACSSSAMRTFAFACFIRLVAHLPSAREADGNGGLFRLNVESRHLLRRRRSSRSSHESSPFTITALDSDRRGSRLRRPPSQRTRSMTRRRRRADTAPIANRTALRRADVAPSALNATARRSSKLLPSARAAAASSACDASHLRAPTSAGVARDARQTQQRLGQRDHHHRTARRPRSRTERKRCGQQSGFSARDRTTSRFTDTPFNAPLSSCADSPAESLQRIEPEGIDLHRAGRRARLTADASESANHSDSASSGAAATATASRRIGAVDRPLASRTWRRCAPYRRSPTD